MNRRGWLGLFLALVGVAAAGAGGYFMVALQSMSEAQLWEIRLRGKTEQLNMIANLSVAGLVVGGVVLLAGLALVITGRRAHNAA